MKTYEQFFGGDAAGQRIGDALVADYALAENPLDAGVADWFWRTSFSASQTWLGLDAAIAKHQGEWREALNASRLGRGLPKVSFPPAGLLLASRPSQLFVRRFQRSDGVWQAGFFDATGARYRVRGISAYKHYYRWLSGQGGADFIRQVRETGACDLRVFLEFGGQGWTDTFLPEHWPGFYAGLSPYSRWLADEGMRWEAVIFTGAPTSDDKHIRFSRIVQELHSHPNVRIELVNENHLDYWAYTKPSGTGLLYSRGSGGGGANVEKPDEFPQPPWDYITYHRRRDEHERGTRGKWLTDDLTFIADFMPGRTETPMIVIPNEDYGFDETFQEGHRLNLPADAYAQGLRHASEGDGNGGVFHCQDGLEAVPLRPNQEQCAREYFAAMRAVWDDQ